MRSLQLGAEVQQRVSPVDLTPTEGESVRRGEVDARLARHCDVVPCRLGEPHLALAVQACRVRERCDGPAEALRELGPGVGDLVRRSIVVECRQLRVGDGVRLECQCPAAVEDDHLVPGEQRRLLRVPGEAFPSVGDAGCNEHRRPESVPREHGKRVLGHVPATVVEAQSDGPVRDQPSGEKRTEFRDVDDAIALRGEKVHLFAEPPNWHGELVVVVGDPVVEEQTKPSRRRREVCSCHPRHRTCACSARLGGVGSARNTDAAAPRSKQTVPNVATRMTERVDVAIVGAGPYGLSVSAHLRALGKVRAFGEPMHTWRTRMPQDMRHRSDWSETSFSAPGRAATFDRWATDTGEPREEPIPLEKFLRYADWFRERFVGDVDESDVARVDHADGTFRLTTVGNDEVDASMLVLAVGAVPFAAAPAPLAAEIGDGIRFATDLQDYSAYASRRVVVVGGGQGGLESALLASRAGADVQLVVRSSLRWFADREPHKPRSRLRQRLYRLAYPAVGYGPPPLNRLVLHPDLFSRLPRSIRRSLTARVLRAGGSPWLREAIESTVRIKQGAAVDRLERRNGGICLRLTDGTALDADAVIVAAGFRFSLERLSFLAPEIGARIAVEEGWPLLDRWFRSTDPNVLFVGFASEHRFGPIVRFIPGTRFSAPRVEDLLRR